jgi:hypothetical protein
MSLFKPHTSIICQDKACKETEYGRKDRSSDKDRGSYLIGLLWAVLFENCTTDPPMLLIARPGHPHHRAAVFAYRHV